MRSILILTLSILAVLTFNGGFSLPSKYEGMIVRKLEFVGLENIDIDDLLDVMITEEGFPLKASEIREDIKAVFREGKLQNVLVEVKEHLDGVRVRFICKERPIIKEIKFKGTEELSEVELTEIISIKDGDVLRINIIEKNIKLIKKKYEDDGFFNVVVKYEIKRDKEDENIVTLIFIVDEGEEIKVAKISILGARKISADKLTDAMETKEDGWFRDGTFKKGIYEEDKSKIIAYYRENGYLDADIIEDKVDYEWENPEEREKRVIFITIKVIEGDQYYFDGYTLSGNEVFASRVFEDRFEQRSKGSIFNDTKFQKDRQLISFTYASKGYIFARVIPTRIIQEREVDIDGEKKIQKFLKIDIKIEEGKQAYIENIIIKGNKKTKDKVIRRELIIKEGELFNSNKVQLSREKVFNLGFFKQVNFDIRPGSREGLMNLIIDVEEQPTGTISLGGGYGTSTGFSIFTDVGENNLLGNGQRVGVRFEYGPRKSSITLSFREPWLLDFPVGFTASIFYELYRVTDVQSMFVNSDDTAEYQKQAFGYSLGLSYRFWYYYGVGSIWSHSFKSYLDPSGNSPDYIFFDVAKGLQEKRTLTLYSYRDSKDNYMNPTRGSRVEFSVSFTGGYILRGEDHYIKYNPEFYHYYSPFHLPFLRSHPCVIELRTNATFIRPPFNRGKLQKIQPRDENEWLDSSDRLFLGGVETLRGYGIDDIDLPYSWQEGLFNRILYGIEFRIPIHPQMLWIALFFDAGSLWTESFWEENMSEKYQEIIRNDKEIDPTDPNDEVLLYDIKDFHKADLMSYFKYSWGFGFKIQIPMMPLRFWFGRKLKWVGRDDGFFKEISGFDFQFGIGDMRF
ncbi:MAG: outer membrane protein assembly factor BamA [Spirochaetota bacterium]|nr:outer membrane protein assembly factor BamA [Spirochaetota bacterium]